jgi:hypothetical protein
MAASRRRRGASDLSVTSPAGHLLLLPRPPAAQIQSGAASGSAQLDHDSGGPDSTIPAAALLRDSGWGGTALGFRWGRGSLAIPAALAAVARPQSGGSQLLDKCNTGCAKRLEDVLVCETDPISLLYS